MTISQVMGQYHKAVSFPWTIEKIENAGFKAAEFLYCLRDDLQQCSDSNDKDVREIVALINELETGFREQIQKN